MNDIPADVLQKLDAGDPRVKQAFDELVRIRAMLQLQVAEHEQAIAKLQERVANLETQHPRLEFQDRNVTT